MRTRWWSWGLLVLVLPAAAAGQDGKYARPNLLIEVGELPMEAKLEQKLTAPALLILDTRSRKEYDKGHIPGAFHVDAAVWAKAFAKSPQDAELWGKLLGKVGVLPEQRVAVYSDDVRDAARVWWILRYWGVKDVRLVNGGWDAWVQAKNPVEKSQREASMTKAKWQPQAKRLATREHVLALLKDRGDACIVDARTKGENRGEVKTAKKAGAIPGAKHLNYIDLIDPKTTRFKSAAALAKLFQDAGINLKQPNVTYCQSGGRAAVMAFALELMGANDVRNYYRSWAEWGNREDTPVEKKK